MWRRVILAYCLRLGVLHEEADEILANGGSWMLSSTRVGCLNFFQRRVKRSRDDIRRQATKLAKKICDISSKGPRQGPTATTVRVGTAERSNRSSTADFGILVAHPTKMQTLHEE